MLLSKLLDKAGNAMRIVQAERGKEMFFQEELEEILTHYEGMEQVFKSVIKNEPPGSITCQDNRGREQLLHIYKEDGKRIRRGINHNTKMQRQLAKKEFAQRSLDVLEHNVDVLRQAVQGIVPYDPQKILEEMGRGYQNLPDEYFFDNKRILPALHLDGETEARIDRHRDWGLQPFEQSDYKPHQKRHRTSKGLKVRSKSEALICECCYRWFDLPFHYEQVQIIDNLVIAPDFTFEDFEKKLFFWEHLGMMDDPDYARRNLNKLSRYYELGLVPGDNLILSFDRHGVIDMRIVNDIIQHQVLPRL